MARHEIELNDEYENLLEFSGMSVESIVIDRLNYFIAAYGGKSDRELLVRVKEIPAERFEELEATIKAEIAPPIKEEIILKG